MITFLVNSLYLLVFLLSISSIIYYFFAYSALPDEEALLNEDDLRIVSSNETRGYPLYKTPKKEAWQYINLKK
jgi:hypothetical protein